jgi:Recombinase
MSRRQRRKAEKEKRRTSPATHLSPPSATEIARLTYTRTQAAEALGVTRGTFDRRVLPLIETIDIPWGPRLVPVDELERFAREWRRPARGRAQTGPVGRPRVASDELVHRIQSEHADGKSLHQIARDLNASQTPTAHGGRQWWPSTVRAVLARPTPSS